MDKTEQSIINYLLLDTIDEIVPPGEKDFIAFFRDLLSIPDTYIENAIDLNVYVSAVLLPKMQQAAIEHPYYFKEGSEYRYWFDTVLNTGLLKVSNNQLASEKYIETMEEMELSNPLFENNPATKKSIALFKKRLERNANRKSKLQKPILVWRLSDDELIKLSEQIHIQKITATAECFKNTFSPFNIPASINKSKLPSIAYILFQLKEYELLKIINAPNKKGYLKVATNYFRYYSGIVPNSKYFSKILYNNSKKDPKNHDRLMFDAYTTINVCITKKVLFKK